MVAKPKLPAAPGAERYLISCILNSNDALADVSSLVKADDFYFDIYRYSYQAIVSLVEEGLVPEPMTVYNRLDSVGLAKSEYLAELELLKKSSYDLKNLTEYISQVQATSARRQLIRACSDITRDLYDMPLDTGPLEAVSLAEETIIEVGNKVSNISEVYKMGTDTIAILKERAENPVEIPGLTSGFSALDKSLQGFQNGRLYVLAARQKTGKSIFLMNVALHLAVDLGIPVLMIDTEMPSRQVEDRMLSLLSGVEEEKIRNGMFAFNQDEKKRLFEAQQKLEKAQIYHDYMNEFSVESVVAMSRKYKVQKNIGAVIFDYIKMPDSLDLASLKEHQLLGVITSTLKNRIAGPLDIPVISAVQLGRAAIDAVAPSEEHVADSDRIGRFADVILYFRHKTEKEEEMYGCSKTTGNLVLSVLLSRYSAMRDAYYDIWCDYPVMKMTEVKVRKL